MSQHRPYGTGPGYGEPSGPLVQAVPAQGYPAAYPPALMNGPAPAAKPKRSSVLGVCSFVTIVLLTLVLVFLGYRLGQSTTEFAFDQAWSLVIGAHSSGSVSEAAVGRLSLPEQGALYVVPWVGLAAWIASVVATATRRGRGWGIAGIVFGMLAPWLGFIVALVMGGLASVRL